MTEARVRLRMVVEDDLPIFFEHQRDPEANAMAAFASREREAFMAHWHKIMGGRTNILRTILFDGMVAGNIVSWESAGEHNVGYWIGKEFWGSGIATEALRQFLVEVPDRPLYAHVIKHNLASQRVLEKCGFQRHAVHKVDDGASGPTEELILILPP